MSKAYDMISASLNEIIDDVEKTNGANLKQTVLIIEVDEVKTFTPSEIKAIRLQNNLTQNLMAKFLCVSKKTVEAWESGKNKPNGPSSRLLELLARKAISPIYS
ncbi:helix-turn-helix domain-containing protein [Schwartzia succinivorans]|jgi:putative transcriptional regulator|uniref:Putative transcriptional regulator n=1 Tax=Schwartzia succinivorans DSM 10502 TaxID=1123243 RepID=A0A1M4YMX7_9FIRM|nr:helix-turn-helix domain-containing protein [Schwartzia succinivorans]SHF07140.1 putative transcriptional regulator [Schwartzia succinivorans DSM 10502]